MKQERRVIAIGEYNAIGKEYDSSNQYTSMSNLKIVSKLSTDSTHYWEVILQMMIPGNIYLQQNNLLWKPYGEDLELYLHIVQEIVKTLE